ncbi:50S ribosomal protein L13 [bacterium CG_4_10_14_0_2_um_filter_33_32]|nr:MAG: 50S ribosomal protein L13 [bacterium CG2_30_33_46]PIR67386.1 MAG: 50S ribosomal protein L13 [bacterium CG10_big_fil_rev_8_21_14_0_10_33_18]PIU76774.1 MAG: 50S ribosomal protein L13 [bacterium CG06_land_8_20_14_3_00_33_50]PIW81281.1 MAG: 50S ribosomal protein L13 [bacterium CG_4_8_14_3_um_filter_33_28]PIY85730.1 MAG: 50S ribosomal protein L13 [bacterium CG_4_10_14_0_8_um_filter_33_57]PIZ86567.1 MAG: 50S ribosomal protein L13 [bacterium CG_4_10_14_0_2_um_filter_33_32]PJA72096.1 MAG: 50S
MLKNNNQIKREWYIIDAKDHILGRLASKVANVLYGKTKVNFIPNQDMGDYVIVINAKDIKTTGNKTEQKIYYRHTGYPGGIKSEVLKDLLKRDATQVIQKAVKGMLPKNKISVSAIKRLKVYVDENYDKSYKGLKELKLDRS